MKTDNIATWPTNTSRNLKLTRRARTPFMESYNEMYSRHYINRDYDEPYFATPREYDHYKRMQRQQQAADLRKQGFLA